MLQAIVAVIHAVSVLKGKLNSRKGVKKEVYPSGRHPDDPMFKQPDPVAVVALAAAGIGMTGNNL